VTGSTFKNYPRRLKNCTARSCFSAAARVLKVPRFRRFPVLGSFFLEYRRYFPDGNFRIIAGSSTPRQESTKVLSCGSPSDVEPDAGSHHAERESGHEAYVFAQPPACGAHNCRPDEPQQGLHSG
jgi:hypothetical protein